MISERRRRCEHFARCGKTGHYYDSEKEGWVRCPCLEMDRNQERLGDLFCEDLFEKTTLRLALNYNLIIEGTLETVRRHVAGAVLLLMQRNQTWETIKSQRLAEIWLGKDSELATTATLGEVDLLVLFLGFAELPNKRLPECILELLDRRFLSRKPTWIHMNFDFAQLAHRYGEELARRLGAQFKRTDLDE